MPSSVDCQSQTNLVLPFSLQVKTVLGPGRRVRPQPGGSRYAASEPPLPIFDPQFTWVRAGHVDSDLQDGLGLDHHQARVLKNSSAETHTTSQSSRGRTCS